MSATARNVVHTLRNVVIVQDNGLTIRVTSAMCITINIHSYLLGLNQGPFDLHSNAVPLSYIDQVI